MTRQQIKDEIIGLLTKTGRSGIAETVRYLLDSTFFDSRCHSHHRFAGGLAQHSLEACRWALAHSGGLPEDSVVLAALLHDTCTAWSPLSLWARGHGRRSVDVLEKVCHLSLTKEEREAILLHMHRDAPQMRTNPLARLIWKADKTSAAGSAPLHDNACGIHHPHNNTSHSE